LVQRKQLIGVLDTSYVNSTSIFNTLDFLEYKYLRIKSYKDLTKINKLIIPGIGNFRKIIDNLIKEDLFRSLQEFILQKNFTLGICLGMQILCQHSEEGNCEGLNIIKAKVKEFELNKTHIGWNKLTDLNNFPLLKNIDVDEKFFYFVHRFYVEKNQTFSECQLCISDFNSNEFISCFQRENDFGVQFHPEKSQRQGIKLIKNFLDL